MTLSLSHGILGQVWRLIVSIPDLCPLSYFVTRNVLTFLMAVFIFVTMIVDNANGIANINPGI